MRRPQSGFTLLEILVAVSILSMILGVLGPLFYQYMFTRQTAANERAIESLRDALASAYRQNLVLAESSAAAELVLPGGTLANGTRTSAANLAPLAGFSSRAVADLARDGFARPMTVHVSRQLSQTVGGSTVFYRVIAVVSNGKGETVNPGTVFDPNTGRLTLAGYNSGALVDGFAIARQAFDDTHDKLSRIAGAYRSYAQTRYLSDPNRDLSIDYFANVNPAGSPSSRWDGGGAIGSTGGAAMDLVNLPGVTQLGLADSDMIDSYNQRILVDNSSPAIKHPDNPAAASTLPPFNAAIRTTLPGGQPYQIHAVGSF
ncbi:hypothetical protein QR66_08405 [Chromobacterium piscinae]|nr:hypothetical protein QR66_08405 [Chromobacterium piscinae]